MINIFNYFIIQPDSDKEFKISDINHEWSKTGYDLIEEKKFSIKHKKLIKKFLQKATTDDIEKVKYYATEKELVRYMKKII